MLLARPGNVMCASNHGLHPTETRIACRADLFRTKVSCGNLQKPITAFVEQQFAVPRPCTDDLSFIALEHQVGCGRQIAGSEGSPRTSLNPHPSDSALSAPSG